MLVKRNPGYLVGVGSSDITKKYRQNCDGENSLDKNQHLTKEQLGQLRDCIAEMSCEIDYMNKRLRKIMDIINNIYLS